MIVAHARYLVQEAHYSHASKRNPIEDGKQFDIVCGYGRLEALVALGEKKIPTVIETTREEMAQGAHTGGGLYEGTTH